MKITLEKKEAEELFHTALCNGSYIRNYGLELTWDEDDYAKAKKRLQKKMKDHVICFEDVLLEILRGGDTLTMVDNENGEKPRTISLRDVHRRMTKTPVRHLMDAINEQDDADTAEVILQTVFYGEVIFG